MRTTPQDTRPGNRPVRNGQIGRLWLRGDKTRPLGQGPATPAEPSRVVVPTNNILNHVPFSHGTGLDTTVTACLAAPVKGECWAGALSGGEVLNVGPLFGMNMNRMRCWRIWNVVIIAAQVCVAATIPAGNLPVLDDPIATPMIQRYEDLVREVWPNHTLGTPEARVEHYDERMGGSPGHVLHVSDKRVTLGFSVASGDVVKAESDGAWTQALQRRRSREEMIKAGRHQVADFKPRLTTNEAAIAARRYASLLGVHRFDELPLTSSAFSPLLGGWRIDWTRHAGGYEFWMEGMFVWIDDETGQLLNLSNRVTRNVPKLIKRLTFGEAENLAKTRAIKKFVAWDAKWESKFRLTHWREWRLMIVYPDDSGELTKDEVDANRNKPVLAYQFNYASDWTGDPAAKESWPLFWSVYVDAETGKIIRSE